MAEVDGLSQLVQLLRGDGGTIALLIIALVSLQRRWIVVGWVYDQCIQDGVVCRTEVTKRIGDIDAEVAEYRKEQRTSRD